MGWTIFFVVQLRLGGFTGSNWDSHFDVWLTGLTFAHPTRYIDYLGVKSWGSVGVGQLCRSYARGVRDDVQDVHFVKT
jgi:hypothetical protein